MESETYNLRQIYGLLSDTRFIDAYRGAIDFFCFQCQASANDRHTLTPMRHSGLGTKAGNLTESARLADCRDPVAILILGMRSPKAK